MRIANERAAVAFLTIVVLLGTQACGGGEGGGGGSATATTYEGAIAGASETTDQTGTLSVDIQAAVAESSPLSFIIRSAYAASLTATGTFSPAGGSAVTLSGTYNDSTGALSLSGDGYTFTGTITDGVMSGDYENGDADTDIGGGFAGLDSTTDTVTVLCGTFENGTDDSYGTFNIVIASDNTVTGVRINHFRRHEYRALTGTKSGNTLDIEVDNGRTGTGTLSDDGNSVTGEFVNGNGETGTFSGSAGACQ